MKTHDGRKLSPQAQQELRHRVVHAILEEQMFQTEACRIFGVGRTSIHNWLKAHRKGGDAALKAQKRGPKHQSRLAGHQAATIVRLITDRCPDQLKLPFALWTRDAVRQLIETRYTIQHFGFGLDGGSVFETLGVYAAETAASRLRARPESGPTLVGTRLS